MFRLLFGSFAILSCVDSTARITLRGGGNYTNLQMVYLQNNANEYLKFKSKNTSGIKMKTNISDDKTEEKLPLAEFNKNILVPAIGLDWEFYKLANLCISVAIDFHYLPKTKTEVSYKTKSDFDYILDKEASGAINKVYKANKTNNEEQHLDYTISLSSGYFAFLGPCVEIGFATKFSAALSCGLTLYNLNLEIASGKGGAISHDLLPHNVFVCGYGAAGRLIYAFNSKIGFYLEAAYNFAPYWADRLYEDDKYKGVERLDYDRQIPEALDMSKRGIGGIGLKDSWRIGGGISIKLS